MNELASKIISFILHPEFSGFLYYVRLVFIIISSILFGAIIFLLFNTSWVKHRFLENAKEILTYKPFQKNKTAKRWNSATEKIESGDYKMGIIEADNMLEDILEDMGAKGDSVREKLDNVESLKNIDELKEARKIRNNIVHDPDYRISPEEAKKAFEEYRTAFQDLDIL